MDHVIGMGIIEGDVLNLSEDAYRELIERYRPKIVSTTAVRLVAPVGPGTELKKLIAKFGFKPKSGCKCTKHIQEMNVKGCDWCEQNIDTISEWLREEAQRSGLPFIETGARILVRRAIKIARKKKFT